MVRAVAPATASVLAELVRKENVRLPVPRAASLPSRMTPSRNTVCPLKVLVPERVNVPIPSLVIPRAPLTTPLKTWAVLAAVPRMRVWLVSLPSVMGPEKVNVPVLSLDCPSVASL